MKILEIQPSNFQSSSLQSDIYIFGDIIAIYGHIYHIDELKNGKSKITGSEYIPDDAIIKRAIELYYKNKAENPDIDTFYFDEDARIKADIPRPILIRGTKNKELIKHFINTITDFIGRRFILQNVNLDEDDLLLMFSNIKKGATTKNEIDRGNYVLTHMIAHPVFSKKLALLFAGESNKNIIKALSERTDVIDDEVLNYFRINGSKLIKTAFSLT